MEDTKDTTEHPKESDTAVLREDEVQEENLSSEPTDPTASSTNTVEPQVAFVDGTGPEARAMTTLKQADESLTRMTTAGKKPIELFKSLDSDALSCAMSAIQTRIDDEVVSGPFLLTEIDHWDVERERILLVTGKNLCSIRYDFISQVVSEIRTVPLVLIDELVYGEITYPKLSAGHSHKGNVLKISWGKDHQPSFAQRWNPFSTDIRLALYQSHPMWKKGHSENKQLSVKDFMPELQKAVAKVKETEMPISNEPVYQGSYWGLGSLIHNQSELGFNKRRGGIDY